MSSAAIGQGGQGGAPAPAPPASRTDTGAGVSVTMQMFGADLLKLRKKRGTLIWALVLALAPIVIFFAVTAIQHSSNPQKYEPAGGMHAFTDGLRVLALFFGPLAAILIGVEAGTGDASAGVFRDLVVTGRSRLSLFVSRLPAALALCWAVILTGFVLLVAGTFAFASNLPTPGGALIFNGLFFALFATGVLCLVAVGFASLTTSKPASITALIGWQLVASPLLVSIDSLGSARRGLLSQALAHFSPVHIDGGGHGAAVSLSQGTAILVTLIWLAVFLVLGAWRTRSMDA
jgi:ABC-type transport system involved in multi-copper enzyme maturation permease subunit